MSGGRGGQLGWKHYIWPPHVRRTKGRSGSQLIGRSGPQLRPWLKRQLGRKTRTTHTHAQTTQTHKHTLSFFSLRAFHGTSLRAWWWASCGSRDIDSHVVHTNVYSYVSVVMSLSAHTLTCISILVGAAGGPKLWHIHKVCISLGSLQTWQVFLLDLSLVAL